MLGAPVEQHNSAAFMAFLESLLATVPRAKEVHVILDNLSVHKSRQVQRFVTDHPRLPFHFTPTYSFWLNQVENWFSKIERDVIARGVFTSVGDLARKLMRYIKRYNLRAKPSHRINPHGSVSVGTGHWASPCPAIIHVYSTPDGRARLISFDETDREPQPPLELDWSPASPTKGGRRPGSCSLNWAASPLPPELLQDRRKAQAAVQDYRPGSGITDRALSAAGRRASALVSTLCRRILRSRPGCPPSRRLQSPDSANYLLR